MRKQVRWLRDGGLAALALSGLLMMGCTERELSAAPEIRPVRTVAVRYQSDVVRQSYAGSVLPRYEMPVGFRVSGKIAQRLVDIGQTVEQGQVLAKLDPEDLKLQLRATQAQLRQADADQVRAKADFLRYEQLQNSVAYNQSTHDQRRATYLAAEGRVAQLRDQIKLAENQLAYTDLTAPANGVITALSAEAGQVVQAGQTIATLARTDELEVVASVPETKLDDLRSATAASATFWSGDNKPVPVILREVSPSADPATRTYRVRYSIPPSITDVRIGMSATLNLTGNDKGKFALLPLTSVFQDQGKPAVWTVDPATGRLTLNRVDVAAFQQKNVKIGGGVPEGALVVTAGVNKLDSGTTVRLMAEARP